MSSKDSKCGRCGGSGFFGPLSVCGGKCFACNRGAVASRGPRTWNREAFIVQLLALLNAAKGAAARGELSDWQAGVTDPDASPYLPGILAAAPEDVRARFVAALDKVAA
jgi:hypothetical protein